MVNERVVYRDEYLLTISSFPANHPDPGYLALFITESHALFFILIFMGAVYLTLVTLLNTAIIMDYILVYMILSK